MNQSSLIKLAKHLEIRPEKCNKALIIRPEKCDLYLERFFRNLLFGDKWDLHNRYLHINPTEEWTVQPNLATPSSTPSSTRQVPEQELSVKEMMAAMGLKDRENFVNLYLNPAMAGSYIRLLYPQSPRHPRQKYLLTEKGLALYKELGE